MKREITYFEKAEMDALLAAPDRRTPQGQRDYALLLFLYNTGARADEAAQLKVGNLELAKRKRERSVQYRSTAKATSCAVVPCGRTRSVR